MLDNVPINELNHHHYITKLTLHLDVIEILDNHHYIIKTTWVVSEMINHPDGIQ